MPDEEVREVGPLLFRHDLHEIDFDLDRVVFFGESYPLAHATHMGIDHNPGNSKGVSENDIGRLPSDAGKGHHLLQRFRYVTPEPSQQLLAAFLDGFGLIPVEARGSNVLFQFWQISLCVVFCRSVLLEQGGGDLIHPDVRTLGREDRGNEKLERAGERESDRRVGDAFGKNLDDVFHPFGVGFLVHDLLSCKKVFI